MKTLTLILLPLVIFSCGTNTQYVPVPGPTVTITNDPSVPTEQDNVSLIVDVENSYREGLGQTALTSGLSCTLYTTTGGSYINPTSINGASQSPTLTGLKTAATFLLTQAFNQPVSPTSTGLNILPLPLQGIPQYQNNILVTCSGQLVVTQTNYYALSVTSDDGSAVYVDGGFLLDNDGGHGANTVVATKYLRQGIHAFTLKFSQSGGGSQALVFSANGTVVDPMYFYH